MTLATIPAGTEIIDSESGVIVITAQDIHADCHIIFEDIEVSECTVDGRQYTVFTADIIYSSKS